jgi:hypothetical protein
MSNKSNADEHRTRRKLAPLTESDLATLDALSILFSIAIGLREGAGQQVAKALDARIQHWAKRSKPKAAGILAVLKKMTTDPKMLTARRQRAVLRYGAPKGRA